MSRSFVLFVSFDVSKIRNFSFSFQTFFSFSADFFLNPLIYKAFRMKLFFLSDSVRAEVRVRLVECDRVAHGINSVVKLVHGFVQLLAVLVLLPFVVAKLLNQVHTPRRDK